MSSEINSVEVEMGKVLQDGIAEMQLELPPRAITVLFEYLSQLIRWNGVYNLTAVREPHAIVRKHLLDSLAVLPFARGNSMLDVGAGAGLPGIPVAIAKPDLAVTLLDSNGKKTRFLTHIKSKLQLENVTVLHRRVEQFKPAQRFVVVTSRAFASLSKFDTQCRRLCRDDGEIVAMLGKRPGAEDVQLIGNRLIALESVNVPGIAGDRHIARIRP